MTVSKSEDWREPWSVQGHEYSPNVCDRDDRAIIGGEADDAYLPTIGEAERIVECVNACRSIPSAELSKMDSGKGKTLMQSLLLMDPQTNRAMEIIGGINFDNLGNLVMTVGTDGVAKYRHTIHIEELK